MEEFIRRYRVVGLYEELAQTEKKETMLGQMFGLFVRTYKIGIIHSLQAST